MTNFTYEYYKKCLHPDEATSEFWLSDRIYEDKLAKYELAKKFKPNYVAEVGVRYGYSGYAFLSGCDCIYHGYELPQGNRRSGGVRGTDTIPWVKEHFAMVFGVDRSEFSYINSQEVLGYPLLNGGFYDMFHVDANHSYIGCFHDCVTALYALKPGGVLVVDDQDNGTVAKSTLGFIETFRGNISDSYIAGTDYIIIKK